VIVVEGAEPIANRLLTADCGASSVTEFRSLYFVRVQARIGEVVQQRGLAHTRFAADHQGRAAPVLDPAEHTVERTSLGAPTAQRRTFVAVHAARD
jgi:hypothetical protein